MLKRKVVLVSCGAFNPITNMHLRMFELARDALNSSGNFEVEKGVISPVGDEYDKKGLLKCEHRLEMVRLALKSSLWIRYDDWECKQEKWIPTVKVLRYVKTKIATENALNQNSPSKRKISKLAADALNDDEVDDIKVILLCGADVLETMQDRDVWPEAELLEILRDFGIVCISRTSYDANQTVYELDLMSQYKNNITLVVDYMPNDVSSTKVRRALERGESVKYVVADEVLQYIENHKLYQTEPNRNMLLSPVPHKLDEPDVYHQNESVHRICSGLALYTSPQAPINLQHTTPNIQMAANQQSFTSQEQHYHRVGQLPCTGNRIVHSGRRSESLERRKTLLRTTTFDRGTEWNNSRVISSFDSLDAPPLLQSHLFPTPQVRPYWPTSTTISGPNRRYIPPAKTILEANDVSAKLQTMRVFSVSPETSV